MLGTLARMEAVHKVKTEPNGEGRLTKHDRVLDFKATLANEPDLRERLEKTYFTEKEIQERQDLEVAMALEKALLPFTCPICEESLTIDFSFTVAACNHRFCLICISRHCFACLGQKTYPIRCPSCIRSQSITTGVAQHEGPVSCLEMADLELFLNRAELDAFLELSLQTLFSSKADHFVRCAKSECPAMAELEHTDILRFDCPLCKTSTCVQCKVEYHLGMTCNEYIEVDKRALEEAEGYLKARARRCPHCLALIERMGGCDHMNCTKCNKPFNWAAAKPYKDK